jgi:hypothetical protein
LAILGGSEEYVIRGTVDIDLLIAWNFYNPQDLSEQVDILISEDLKGKRRVRMETLAGAIQVLSRQDLIAASSTPGTRPAPS